MIPLVTSLTGAASVGETASPVGETVNGAVDAPPGGFVGFLPGFGNQKGRQRDYVRC